jgi:hypothetical protein
MVERHKTLADYAPAGPKVRAGGELDAYCTKCRMMLTHTILAMERGEPVRVECRTCHSQHAYRPNPPGAAGARPARKRAVEKGAGTWAPPPPRRPERAWQEATAGKDLGRPVAYHPKTTFEVGAVLIHGKFGLGVVVGLKEGDKILVTFQDDTRTLVHGRG